MRYVSIKNILSACCALVVALEVFGCASAPSAPAASVASAPAGGEGNGSAIPVEVKFILDNKVLDANGRVNAEYVKAFSLAEPSSRIIVYVDTPDRAFFSAGWINRLRERGEKKDDCTYKRRYAVSDGNIDAAVALAKSEGIDGNAGFEAELDWSAEKVTLDYSKKIKIEPAAYPDFSVDSLASAVHILESAMPAEEADFAEKGWGTRLLKDSMLVGPVKSLQYKGKISDKKITLEVWIMENPKTHEVSRITELSFGAKSYEQAAELRKTIYAHLSGLGVLEKKSVLKTSAVFDFFTGK